MPYQLTFLIPKSGNPVTKTHSETQQNNYKERFWTSIEVIVTSIGEFHAAVVAHALQGNVLLASQLIEPLSNTRRANKSDNQRLMQWICFDLDGTSYPDPQEFLNDIPWARETSYIVQYSASYGISPDIPGKSGLRCHIFMLLSHGLAPNRIKAIVTELNHSLVTLNSDISLSREKSHLNYALDPAMAQPSQLITIAPPICLSPYTDTMSPETRIVMYERDKMVINTDEIPLIDLTALNKTENKKLNALRQEQGLTKITLRDKNLGEIKIAKGVQPTTLHHIGDDRGYSYYNYADGDSNSYYHPIDNPTLIYCFKPGLLPMLHKELDAESFRIASQRAFHHRIKTPDKPVHGIFYEFRQDKYYSYELNNSANTLQMQKIGLTSMETYCAGNNIPFYSLEDIPVIEQVFDLHNPVLLDADARTANTFVEPALTINKEIQETPSYNPDNTNETLKELCPHIYALMMHPMAGDEQGMAYFINWLSALVSYRVKPEIIIAMQGVQGTGKDLLITEILEPLLNSKYVTRKDQNLLGKKFNSFLAETRLVVLNEVSIKPGDPKNVYSDLKNLSTSHTLEIRKMRVDQAGSAKIHFGIMMFSNEPGFMPLDETDRRVLVYPRQETPLMEQTILGFNMDTQFDEFLQALRLEVPVFADYLYNYDLDHSMLRKVPHTEARAMMIEASKDSSTLFCDAIRTGDFSFFLDVRNQTVSDFLIERAALGFNLQAILEDAINVAPKPMVLTMDHLRTLYFYTTHNEHMSPIKLRRLLMAHNISLQKRVTDPNDPTHRPTGVFVHWTITPEDITECLRQELTIPDNLPPHLQVH